MSQKFITYYDGGELKSICPVRLVHHSGSLEIDGLPDEGEIILLASLFKTIYFVLMHNDSKYRLFIGSISGFEEINLSQNQISLTFRSLKVRFISETYGNATLVLESIFSEGNPCLGYYVPTGNNETSDVQGRLNLEIIKS